MFSDNTEIDSSSSLQKRIETADAWLRQSAGLKTEMWNFTLLFKHLQELFSNTNTALLLIHVIWSVNLSKNHPWLCRWIKFWLCITDNFGGWNFTHVASILASDWKPEYKCTFKISKHWSH